MLQAKPAAWRRFAPLCLQLHWLSRRRFDHPFVVGTYGEPGGARLDELLVGNSSGGYGTTYEYGTLVSSVSQLTPGDVIGYDWDGSGDGSMSGIDHTVIYTGNDEVDCHATSHLAANWTLGGADDYFFIHITLPDSIVPDRADQQLAANVRR